MNKKKIQEMFNELSKAKKDDDYLKEEYWEDAITEATRSYLDIKENKNVRVCVTCKYSGGYYNDGTMECNYFFDEDWVIDTNFTNYCKKYERERE